MRLPETSEKTDRLECIRIDDSSNWHRWTSVPGTTLGFWQGREAAEILGQVAELPAGGVMRCFRPGFGIRAHSADQVLFEIAFCFECHNALLFQPAPGDRGDLIGFKADSRRAMDLLSLFRAF